MKAEEFDELVKRRIERIQATLMYKGGEYATIDDRLANFNDIGHMFGVWPEVVAGMYALKHLDSVIKMVQEKGLQTQERVDEKIGDLINYLILIEACIKQGESHE